jgi:hypothetical protein
MQVADDGVLKAGDQVESLRIAEWRGRLRWLGRLGGRRAGKEGFAAGFGFGAQVVELDVAQDGGLDSGKRKEEVRVEVGDGGGLRGLGARGGLPARCSLVLICEKAKGTARGLPCWARASIQGPPG